MVPVLTERNFSEMNVARFVSRVSPSLLNSFSTRVAPVLWAQCRTIFTDKDHIKFGNVGGEMAVPDANQSLDVYLGKWIHDPTEADQLQEQMQEQERLQQKVMSELGVKNYIEYIRNNGTWKVQQGLVGAGKTLSYEFILGQTFTMLYPDNNFVKILIYQDGERMVWDFHPVDAPEDVLRVRTHIQENKLFWKTEYPHGLNVTRVYLRE